MYFSGLFKKRLSIKQGEALLTEYCAVNGFNDINFQWKAPKHATSWFAYYVKSKKMISKNWVSFHPIRGNDKYSVWIDLVTEEIREILR